MMKKKGDWKTIIPGGVQKPLHPRVGLKKGQGGVWGSCPTKNQESKRNEGKGLWAQKNLYCAIAFSLSEKLGTHQNESREHAKKGRS